MIPCYKHLSSNSAFRLQLRPFSPKNFLIFEATSKIKNKETISPKKYKFEVSFMALSDKCKNFNIKSL